MTKNEYLGYCIVDSTKVKAAVAKILEAIGEDRTREGLVDTPDRIARMYERIFCGYNKLPDITKFKAENDDLQARKCDFVSMCEHHIVPFSGVAYIAYLPDKYILGMDKLDLIVDWCASKLQLQERLTAQIADTVMNEAQAKWCMVQTYGVHYCAKLKGNEGNFAESAIRGNKDLAGLRDEALFMFSQLDKGNKI
jgi:GTP cyclohydrolase I